MVNGTESVLQTIRWHDAHQPPNRKTQNTTSPQPIPKPHVTHHTKHTGHTANYLSTVIYGIQYIQGEKIVRSTRTGIRDNI